MIRIVKQNTAPDNTNVLWIDTREEKIKIFGPNGWQIIGGMSDEDKTLIDGLKQEIDDLIGLSSDDSIDNLNEIKKFLEGFKDNESLKEWMGQYYTKEAVNGFIDAINGELDDKATKDEVQSVMETIIGLHATITASASPASIYKGEATNVNINTNVTFNGKALPHTVLVDGSERNNPYSVSDTRTFQVAINIDSEDPKFKTSIARSVAVNAYYPRYYGRYEGETIDSATILGLNKMPVASNATANNLTYTDTKDSYLWLCVPNTMAVNSVVSSGFAVPMNAYVEVAVSGKGTYRCYRSTNKINAGSITFNVG